MIILRELVRRFPGTAGKWEIYDAMYSDSVNDPPLDSIVQVYISKLRAKLEPVGVKIGNAFGYGYFLDVASKPLIVDVPGEEAA